MTAGPLLSPGFGGLEGPLQRGGSLPPPLAFSPSFEGEFEAQLWLSVFAARVVALFVYSSRGFVPGAYAVAAGFGSVAQWICCPLLDDSEFHVVPSLSGPGLGLSEDSYPAPNGSPVPICRRGVACVFRGVRRYLTASIGRGV